MITQEFPIGTLWTTSIQMYRAHADGECCSIPEGSESFLLLCQPFVFNGSEIVFVLGRCGVEEFAVTHFSNGNLTQC